jgi:TetR/AcrR family transcriptional regulator
MRILFESVRLSDMTQEERRKWEIEQRRETAINVANRLFYLNGYENVTMDDIAREAELSKTTLYSYFTDKEALFFVIVNRGIKIFKGIIEKEAQLTQVPGINTGVIKTASNQFLMKHPDYVRAYLYFRSGKFDILNDNCINSDAKEVLEITKEIFDQAVLAKETSIENRILSSGVSPVVLTAFNILICEGVLNGILNMDPFLKEILETQGVTLQQFQQEAVDLVQRLILIPENSINTER